MNLDRLGAYTVFGSVEYSGREYAMETRRTVVARNADHAITIVRAIVIGQEWEDDTAVGKPVKRMGESFTPLTVKFVTQVEE